MSCQVCADTPHTCKHGYLVPSCTCTQLRLCMDTLMSASQGYDCYDHWGTVWGVSWGCNVVESCVKLP